MSKKSKKVVEAKGKRIEAFAGAIRSKKEAKPLHSNKSEMIRKMFVEKKPDEKIVATLVKLYSAEGKTEKWATKRAKTKIYFLRNKAKA